MLERATSIFLSPKVFYIAIYVSIWSLHSLLIKLSLKRNVEAGGEGYPYDIWLMALNTELVKLFLSALYLCFRPEAKNGPVQALKDLWGVSQYAKYFAIPAVIYCIANVLMFINLRLVAVPTYRILINSRIIFSGLLLQQFFSKRLTLMQWVALGILIFGCTLEQLGSFNIAEGGVVALVFIGIQGLCSSLGGVYFQWLLQRNTGAQDIGLVEKNIFLYGWMSCMNVVYILVMQPQVLSGAAFWRNYSPDVLPIVIAGSFGGFTTSLLLRHLDVIAKEYANSLEMVSVYLLSHELLGTTLSGYMAGSIMLVGVSLLIYTREDANKSAAPTPAPAIPLKSLGFDEKDKKMEEGESEPDSAPDAAAGTGVAPTTGGANDAPNATAASTASGDVVQRVRTEAVAAR